MIPPEEGNLLIKEIDELYRTRSTHHTVVITLD